MPETNTNIKNSVVRAVNMYAMSYVSLRLFLLCTSRERKRKASFDDDRTTSNEQSDCFVMGFCRHVFLRLHVRPSKIC
jgi:hypothetical protein